MNGSALKKYIGGNGRGPGSEDIPDVEESEGFAYGWLRGARDRAIMLELRQKTGNIRAVSYHAIFRVDFDSSEGITLFHGREIIKIRGRNLKPELGARSLFEGIVRQRVHWVQEANQSAAIQADKNAVVIEAIEWQQ
jgi:hypothetical protein